MTGLFMSDPTFRKVLFMVPPTSNSMGNTPQTRRFKRNIAPWLESLDRAAGFTGNDRLYGRIIYFNHQRHSARDIHNIIKPLFDALEEYIFDDDKQIKHFEGYRLDMEHNNTYFEVDLNISKEPDLIRALSETACLVEVGLLPMQPSNLVVINWLS